MRNTLQMQSISHVSLEFYRLGIQILSDHECHLKGDGMLKFSEVKSCKLADFFQTVNKSISMYKQLSGGFGYVQIVFKEALNGH